MTKNKKNQIQKIGLILGLTLIIASIIPYGNYINDTVATTTEIIEEQPIKEEIDVDAINIEPAEIETIKVKPISLADLSIVSEDFPPQRTTAEQTMIVEQPIQQIKPAVITQLKKQEAVVKTTEIPPKVNPEHWLEYTVKQGDNLAKIYKKLGFSHKDLHYLSRSGHRARQLSKINPKQTLKFLVDKDGHPKEVILIRSEINKLVAVRTPRKFYNISEEKTKLDVKISHSTGLIRSSLFETADKAGLTNGQVMQLVQIFASEIDFALQLHEGDRFSVIHEDYYLNGKKYKSGKILAAEFDLHGRVYQALAYTDAKGNFAYYSPQGKSKNGIFLRTPLNFTRISSHFTKRRWHPTLKRWKAHRGVDYAAPTGTAVKSTAKGKVTFKGWQNGYGRVVFIQHQDKYTTVYAHLSRFNKKIRKGAKVNQGQVIGFVGQSGRATGPHLHYEFRINNKHQNPEKLSFKSTTYLTKKNLARFKKKTAALYGDLKKLRPTVIAMSK